ncbi:hypothetical protein [Desulfobacula phenolica]|uniref:Uncharacterized protein n=1 Tax=Desulfobacula phenolica TaxID=90732 RepID=A0A1H2KDY0_9BACT|nr:hypothetical protein [Desulfobacula phenolica]SDU66638.1 hypothetical protein SAMN04487931_1333 [Desulfobacula phenolica]
MKKILVSITIVLITFFIITVGYCEDEKVRVYFGNGVFNHEKDAKEGLEALHELLDKVNIQGDLKGKILCEISYNPTDGIRDLYETAKQTHDLAWSAFWRILGGIDSMPNFIQDGLKTISARFDENMVKSYPSIQKHIEKYNEDLCQGDKVVVVAHSQGNLYANIAYKGINENVIDGFGIVSVANPSWYVAGDDSNQFYTTIDEDLIIGFLPGALRSNVNNFPGLNLDDLSGHMFIKSYLVQDLEAESRILDQIITKICNLEWPDGSCTQYLLATCVVESGDKFCMVWDLNNNQMAEDVMLDIGGIASFPCKKDDISFWLADKNLSGTPVIEVSDPVEGSPIYFGSPPPPDTYTYYYNDTNCQREGYCTEESAFRSYTIGVNGIDEKGNTGLVSYETHEYVNKRVDGYTGYIKSYQTYETPISARVTYQFPLVQIKISSLTNTGGTRARAIGGNFVKSEEKWWTVEALWPATEETKWYYIDRTTDISLEYKSPFSDKSIKTLNLLSTDEAKVFQDRTCLTQQNKQTIIDEKFAAKGIRNSEYMIVFYTNETKGMNTMIPCCPEQGSSYISCPPWGSISYANCISDGNYSHYQAIDFEVKAFIQKVESSDDINEVNPFEIPENSDFGSALFELKNQAADFSNDPGDRYCSEVLFDLNFIE